MSRYRIMKTGFKYQPEIYDEVFGWIGFSKVFRGWAPTHYPKRFWFRRSAENLLRTTLEERDLGTDDEGLSPTPIAIIMVVTIMACIGLTMVIGASRSNTMQNRADLVARCRSAGGEMGGEHCYVNGKILEEE